jgi:phosphatidylinositol alpha-1,6-mannosyltransferase
LADWADLWGRRGIADERAGLQGRLVSWLDVATEASVHEAADGATVISTFLERQMRELGMAPERIHRLPVGSNADLIRPQLVDEMRRRYGIPGESMVLASGGFAPYDRQLLLETMKHLRALEPTALLLVVGGESRAVVRAAKKAGLAEAVRSFGVVAYEELGSLLACGDVMILPLGNRPLNAARFPNRFGDYLAAGRPIATNPTGDVGEVVKHEGVGIVAPDEPALFAEAIFDLLRDRPRRQRQGRRARELAETRYSWTALAEPLTSFVNGL